MPDPTTLTREAVEGAKEELRREIGHLEHILNARREGAINVIVQRLVGMDEAIRLLQNERDASPGRMQAHITEQRALIEQKFSTITEIFGTQNQKFEGIQTQFSERDVRSEQSSTATKVAIDAALQAQKEMWAAQNTNIALALARIEATLQKQIEQVVTLSQTTAVGMDGKINDLKDRVGLIEGRTAGITSATTSQQASTAVQQGSNQYTLAVVGFLGGTVLGIIGIIIAIMKG